MKLLVVTHDGNGQIRGENFEIVDVRDDEALGDMIAVTENLSFFFNAEYIPDSILTELCELKGGKYVKGI